MKVVLFFLLFTSSAWAQDCSKKDIYLYGNIIFKTKVLFNEFPSVWTVNGDLFSSLYLKIKKGMKVDEVKIDLVSEKFNKTYIKKMSADKNKKKLMHIEEINFQKDILPNYKRLPMKMKLRVFYKNAKVCERNFRLEVEL